MPALRLGRMIPFSPLNQSWLDEEETMHSLIALIVATVFACFAYEPVAAAQSVGDAPGTRPTDARPPGLLTVDQLTSDQRLELTHAQNQYRAGIVLTVLGGLQAIPIAYGAGIMVGGLTHPGCVDCGVGVVVGGIMVGLSAAAAAALLTPGILMIVRGRNRTQRILAPSVVPIAGGAAVTWQGTF